LHIHQAQAPVLGQVEHYQHLVNGIALAQQDNKRRNNGKKYSLQNRPNNFCY
jgi:hypothetical protein